MYVYNLNAIIMSECCEDENKERRLLSEFGMYIQYKITKDVAKLPLGFKPHASGTNFMELHNLFCNLFASRMMINTKLQDKDILYNGLKEIPVAGNKYREDMSYFDILL